MTQEIDYRQQAYILLRNQLPSNIPDGDIQAFVGQLSWARLQTIHTHEPSVLGVLLADYWRWSVSR